MNQKSTKAETNTGGALDVVKWFVVVALVVGAIGGNHYYQEQDLLYRVLAVFAVGVAAILVSLTTVKGAAVFKLLKESVIEAKRVVWPTSQETTQTTVMVIIVVFLMALLLWLLDAGIGWLTSLVIG